MSKYSVLKTYNIINNYTEIFLVILAILVGKVNYIDKKSNMILREGKVALILFGHHKVASRDCDNPHPVLG